MSPSELPLAYSKVILKSKDRREESKKQYFSSHAKNGIERRSGRPRSLWLSLGGYPSAHLSMVLGRGNTWVLISK